MPELPEVETTRRGIAPHLDQRVIRHIEVREARLRWPVTEEVSRAVGASVLNIERRAKYLLLNTSAGGALMIHLGMSGSLRVVTDDAEPRKHDHFDLVTERAVIRFNDPRRFGALLWADDPVSDHPLLHHLGPEPLEDEFHGEYLWAASRGRRLAVKNFIMDSRVVVGVGNIYASEALFMAGIHPARAAGRISRTRFERLTGAIRAVLAGSIQQGGTTLRDYVNSEGNPGYFATNLLVYGREGQPCLQCATLIRNRTLGQRSSFYCPYCQR